MPSLNFKSRFAGRVAEGSKPHTIRAWRKRPFVVGDNLSFFTGMRTKQCRRLRGNARCISALPIEIYPTQRKVLLNGKRLSSRKIERLALDDGFGNVSDFWLFFADTHGPYLSGQLVRWQT